MNKYFSLLIVALLGLQCTEPTSKQMDFILVDNGQGKHLGYSLSSGVTIIEQDGLKFKDLNKNGKLDKYEDWRLLSDERARDLASQMTIDQMAGLMLYSAHQMLPTPAVGFGAGTYSGKTYEESGAEAWDLSDQQQKFLEEDNLRHILLMGIENTTIAARWNNKMQAFVEGLGLGIPGNSSSDPRHSVTTKAEFNAGGGAISEWPREIGLAATFDPLVVKEFGEIAAAEYRALGITTALSPQVDLATEPRWFRLGMTFGEDTKLVTDMGRAYIDGFQTSEGEDEIENGWGYQSVNAMVKHWPSGGPEEGGRDGHWAYGKFAVYPGRNFEEHLKPFTQGAFKLDGKTGAASAVMPYYTISYNQAADGTNYANGFSKYIITDLLREKYGYDGVVCTDWLITADEGKTPADFAGKPWGVEKLTVAERHYMCIKAGMDQFGGNNDKMPVIEAYKMGVAEFGEEYMRKRFEQSAVRLLKNIFRLGLFENPYLDVQASIETVGNDDFMKVGYEAQLKSTILLKNKNKTLPITDKKKVYIPKRYTASTRDWWGQWTAPTLSYPVNLEVVNQYYEVTENPLEADFALVFVQNPKSEFNGYSSTDRLLGENGYIPISLQYLPYMATQARSQSIAAGDPVVDPSITNRSYNGKTSRTANANDLEVMLRTRDMMQNKPVIAVIDLSNPMVFNEFEKDMDGIILHFGSSDKSLMEILSGRYEPNGLLPIQMPANMTTVEKQFEDVGHDMECHKDTEGSTYDFGFGLNWSGVIKDERTEKYNRRQ